MKRHFKFGPVMLDKRLADVRFYLDIEKRCVFAYIRNDNGSGTICEGFAILDDAAQRIEECKRWNEARKQAMPRKEHISEKPIIRDFIRRITVTKKDWCGNGKDAYNKNGEEYKK